MKTTGLVSVEFVLVTAALCAFAGRAYKAELATAPANCPTPAPAASPSPAPLDGYSDLPKFKIYYHDREDCWYRDGFGGYRFIGCLYGSNIHDTYPDWHQLTPLLLPCPKCVHGQLRPQKPASKRVPSAI
ncbi:MAG: hypothetical protein QM758_05020 [Armatimonas sp.]